MCPSDRLAWDFGGVRGDGRVERLKAEEVRSNPAISVWHIAVHVTSDLANN